MFKVKRTGTGCMFKTYYTLGLIFLWDVIFSSEDFFSEHSFFLQKVSWQLMYRKKRFCKEKVMHKLTYFVKTAFGTSRVEQKLPKERLQAFISFNVTNQLISKKYRHNWWTETLASLAQKQMLFFLITLPQPSSSFNIAISPQIICWPLFSAYKEFKIFRIFKS